MLPQALKPTALPVARAYEFADPESDDSDVIWYATLTQNLANGGNPQSTLQIDQANDFYWYGTSLQADVAGAAVTESGILVPTIRVIVRDAASQKNLQNLIIPVNSLAGPGERCYRLIEPRRVLANSTLVFLWSSFDTTNTYAHVYLVLHGYTRPAGS